MKNNILIGSLLPLVLILSTASHAATDRPQIESSRVNWIAESEDDNPCDPKKRQPAKYYYSLSMVAIDPALKMYCLNKAIKIDPKYVDAYDRRGNAKRKSGDLKGAVADYSMAIKIDPNYGYSYYNRAVARAELNNKKGAIADYIKAIEIFRRNEQTYEIEIATKDLAEISPPSSAERTDFDNNSKITSISEFKDVRPTDQHFIQLQSLTERYGIVLAYKDSNFHSEIPLSRGQFAMFLDRGLGVVGKLTAMASNGKYKNVYSQFSANNLKLSSVSKVKDISPSSPYHQSVKSLIEGYGINLVDADGKFRPEQPLTEKELEDWLDGVFKIGKNPATNKNINRGQFVIKFNETLDLMNDRIARLTDGNK